MGKTNTMKHIWKTGGKVSWQEEIEIVSGERESLCWRPQCLF